MRKVKKKSVILAVKIMLVMRRGMFISLEDNFIYFLKLISRSFVRSALIKVSFHVK